MSSMTGNQDVRAKVARSINETNCCMAIYLFIYLSFHEFAARVSSASTLVCLFLRLTLTQLQHILHYSLLKLCSFQPPPETGAQSEGVWNRL